MATKRKYKTLSAKQTAKVKRDESIKRYKTKEVNKMIEEEFFNEEEESEAVAIEEFLWDVSWIAGYVDNWGLVEEPLNDEEVRYNEEEGIFYEA